MLSVHSVELSRVDNVSWRQGRSRCLCTRGTINLRSTLRNTDEPNNSSTSPIQFSTARPSIYPIGSNAEVVAVKEVREQLLPSASTTEISRDQRIAPREPSASRRSHQRHAAPQGRSHLEVGKGAVAAL